MRETWIQSLSPEDPPKEGNGYHSSILAWRISWTEEPDGLQFMGSQRIKHNWATNPLWLWYAFSYYWLYNVSLPEYAMIIKPSHCWWIFRLFLVWGYYEHNFLYICVLIFSSVNLEIKLQNYRVYTYSALFYHAKLSREVISVYISRKLGWVFLISHIPYIHHQSTNFVLLSLNFFLIILFFLMLL